MTANDPRTDATTRVIVERVMVERYVSRGVLIFGAIGATVGLVVGLFANPATAWFAVFEIGVPATILGIFVSATAGVLVAAVHRART